MLRLQVVPVAIRIVSFFALAITLGWCAGCGGGSSSGNTAHLEGTVTIGGQPLPADVEASILFRPTQSGQGKTVSVPVVGGRYDSPDTPIGAVKAFFTIQQPTGKVFDNDRGAPIKESKSLVPAKYGAGLDLTVSDDNDAQNFEL
jgi:hypothetical protein